MVELYCLVLFDCRWKRAETSSKRRRDRWRSSSEPVDSAAQCLSQVVRGGSIANGKTGNVDELIDDGSRTTVCGQGRQQRRAEGYD